MAKDSNCLEDTVVQPDYYKKFMCAADKCEENCCARWMVGIDNDTYNKYDKLHDKKMRRKILNSIHINKNSSYKDVDYAFIRFKMDYSCPFLDKTNKCTIHSQLGEEYLGAVCNIYPRYINKLDSFYERSMDCSCIEAAKLILGNKEGINFEKTEEKITGTIFIDKEINTEICGIGYENKAYAKEIRRKSIEIMKNRNYDLSSRIYMLGKFLEETRLYICSDYYNAAQYVNSYNIDLHGEEFKRYDENYKKQFLLYKKMTEKIDGLGIFSKCPSKYFKKNMLNCIKGFKKHFDNYDEGYIVCEKEVFSKYGHIFENYLINEMFKNLFPFSNNNIMYNDYLILLFKYAFIKFYITGQYLYKGNVFEEDIIWSIQSFEKKIGHDTEYLNSVRRYFIENELDNPEFAYILI